MREVLLYAVLMGRRYGKAVALVSLLVVAGCGESQPKQETTAPPKGRLRWLALTPAMHEIASLVDTGGAMARTRDSNYPPAPDSLPTFIAVPLDVETVVRLHPDVVLVEKGMTAEPALRRLIQAGLRLETFQLSTFDSVFAAAGRVGRLMGKQVQAVGWADSGRRVLARYKGRLAGRPTGVLSFFYTQPPMAWGSSSWMDQKLRHVGLENACVRISALPYPQLSAEAVQASRAGVVTVPEGTTSAEAMRMKRIAGAGRVVYLNEDLTARPSLRLEEQFGEIVQKMKE